MFENLNQAKNLTQYKLMYGVPDFGNLKQFNNFETGYSFIKVVSIPKFLTELAKDNNNYANLIENYKHIIEYEFKGLDGLDDITSDPSELTNGISTLNVITKTIENTTNVSMRYTEKAGSVLTRLHTLFLTGIKDPRTQAKTYHGLIDSGVLEAGYENEVFAFLYFVTDNTMTKVEAAYLIMSAQPTKADTSMYNSEKGSIEFKEITVEFNCYPVRSNEIEATAVQVLNYMNTTTNEMDRLVKDSTEFHYKSVEELQTLDT